MITLPSLLGALIIIAVILAVVPMDAQIKSLIVGLIIIAVVVALLTGGGNILTIR